MFFQFFFVKCSNNFFPVKIICNICLRHSIFNFFNQKNFFRPIWSVTFCKNVFIFWYSKNITNFKFKIFISLLESICILDVTRIGVILILLWYVLLYLLTISSNLSINTFFDIEVKIYLYILFFQVLMNISAVTDFPPLWRWIHFYIIFLQK